MIMRGNHPGSPPGSNTDLCASFRISQIFTILIQHQVRGLFKEDSSLELVLDFKIITSAFATINSDPDSRRVTGPDPVYTSTVWIWRLRYCVL